MTLPISHIVASIIRNKTNLFVMLTQIALTVAVISNAAFFAIDTLKFINRDSGIAEHSLFAIPVSPIDEEMNALSDQRVLSELPGIVSSSMVNSIPFSRITWNMRFAEQAEEKELSKSVRANITTADEHFIDTLGLKLIAGRNFRSDEVVYVKNTSDWGASSVTAIVSLAFAKDFYPESADPASQLLGRTIYTAKMPVKVIGVIDKMHGQAPRTPFAEHQIIFSQVFELVSKNAVLSGRAYLVKVSQNDVQSLQTLMKGAVDSLRDVQANRIIKQPIKLLDHKAQYYSQDRLLKNILLVLVSALLLVTCLGIVGMALFNINKRTKQIGVRRALGASQKDILFYFVSEHLIIALFAVVLGGLISILVNYLLMSLFAMAKLPFDFLIQSMIFVVLTVVVAVIGPAHRAALISPATATRTS